MTKCKIIAAANQKGGVGKTTTVINLARALQAEDKKVLMVEVDPQGNLTMCQGIQQPDELEYTVTDLIESAMRDTAPPVAVDAIIRHDQGIPYLPCNIFLGAVELQMVSASAREFLLKSILEPLREHYDYILIDCPPSMQILTVNALNAADSVIIPVQAHYLGAKGLELLLQSIASTKKKLNPGLAIEGVLITMHDACTNYAKKITQEIRDHFGEYIPAFNSVIPASIKVTEGQVQPSDIFEFAPKNNVALGYIKAAKELIAHE